MIHGLSEAGHTDLPYFSFVARSVSGEGRRLPLPLIGPVPGAKGVYAAYGYGGNGITFSFLAAQLIGDLIAGSTSELAPDFALDRDGSSIGR